MAKGSLQTKGNGQGGTLKRVRKEKRTRGRADMLEHTIDDLSHEFHESYLMAKLVTWPDTQ